MIFGIPPLLLAGAFSVAVVRGLFLGYPEKRVPEAQLSRKEQAIVAACADAFFPAGGPIAVSGGEADLVRYFDGYVRGLPKGQATLIRLLLWFIEHGPWVFGPRPVRFTEMSHAQRLRVLAGMQTSPLYFRRVAFLSMRTMLTMGYLANPHVTRAMRLVHDLDPFRLGTAPFALGDARV